MASDQLPRHVDILSFDGGGSRGIMEVSILSDVMRLATIVWCDPEKLSYLTENNANLTPEIRKKLVNDLAKVSKPLHPTQIYDMIVGTSTGALIAFGLVGGKENKSNGKRLPMTLKECIDMYLKKTEEIFFKSFMHRIITFLPGQCCNIPLTTFPKDNVEKALLEQFGDSYLADFEKSESITSIAGAVARQIGQKEELVLFDTSNEAYKYYKTNQVLLASSNAPVYFDTPVRIGGYEFVDGGVGGNCPLAQAIPRAKEIFPEDKITSALSIAPPIPKESHIPRRFQIGYWLNYFVCQSTDGYAVYKDAERRYKSEINFQRLSPRGESLKDFKLDSDAEDMLQAIEEEKLSNEMFLVDVIATASVVVDTYAGKAKESPNVTAAVKIGARLAQMAGDIYVDHSEYELACNAYNTSKCLWKKLVNEDTKIVIAEIDDNIAECFEKCGKYLEAIQLYRQSIDNWKEYSSKSDDPRIAKALQNLAQCLVYIYDYDEAQEKFELALEMQQRMHGQKANADVASVLDRLGWCEWQHGNITKAIHFYQYSLTMKRNLYLTADDLEIAETINNIGICLTSLGKHDEAIKHVQDAFDMRRRLIQTPQEHSLIAESLNNLGFCQVQSKDYTKAQVNLKEANAMYRKIFGNDHLLVALSSENLAKCLCNLNQGNRALELVQQALKTKKASINEVNNSGIAKTLAITGLAFEKTGNFQEAEKFYLESMRMTKVVFGPTHPNIAEILFSLGELLAKQKRNQEAENYFNEAKLT